MLAFFVRRLIGAVLVCIAVTLIVFLIFVLAPGGNGLATAQRIAGKNATPQNVANIERQWGFDRPFYAQYWLMMSKMWRGITQTGNQSQRLVSYTSQQDVVQQIEQGLPVTFSLTIGAGIIWLFFGILVGVLSAITA